MNSLCLGVNIFESPQWSKCKDGLLNYKNRIGLYCLQHSDDKIDNYGLNRVNCIKTRAKDFIPGSNSLKPVIYEMFDALANTGHDYFVFTNSDIIISEEAIDWMLNQSRFDSACFSRVDLEPENRRNFSDCPPYGFDLFYIKSSWWKRNRIDFLNLPNTYAEPCWDLAYATNLHILSFCYFHNKIPLIYHIPHHGRWSINTIEGSFSQNIFNKTILINLWNDYFANNVLRRNYINKRITSEIIAREINVERRIFGRASEL